MDNEYISRAEYAAYQQQQRAQNERVDKRLEILEVSIGKISEINAKVDSVNVSVAHLLRLVQENTADIKQINAERKNGVDKYLYGILAAVVAAVLSYLAARLSIF